ncbi:MAG: hypothetical protein LBE20_00510 [Deltaproteobacteria bacterium]|jgi:hypothetical protein|nr:hypothetical protein [Deltaproteobacteria bacterium]
MRQSKVSVRKNAILVVNELTNRFPDLDFRFNLTENSNTIRYKISNYPSKVREINLNQIQDSTILETILDIKADYKIFDA